ncbi:S41 family peptidase [Lysinibacillus odysseyi]|uniref:S41 family peptidase n=1 Tax=Lysinibacillus odysseyi TaxID=202611 RepID=UPI00068DE4CD|nr:S41 family peptidase [Lysinibacillus odysseyi]
MTKVDEEQRLELGSVFTGIGGLSIPDLKNKHAMLLNESHPERENWTAIFSYYEFVELEGSDDKMFPLHFYKKPPYVPVYTINQRDESTVCLTMTDFNNPDAIVSLINEHKNLLEKAENWIIDVRLNNGGSDTSFFPLLPYIAPLEGMDVSPEDSMLFLCTEANTERRLAEFEEMMQQIEDEETQRVLQIFQREMVKNKGKGFAEFDFLDIQPDSFMKGNAFPKRVIVLSDTFCGSSGDSFVEICKKSSKVTVIGRATMGVNDYANLATQTWDSGFVLKYPTSRLSRIDEGNGMTGVGILPHIHIPWTPDHLREDIDMEHALNLLKLPVI